MAGGPATIQNSSAAYYTIPNQYATAFQSGWALDQRLDSASATGGFLTNCSPSSSGMQFVSTGDATPLYLIGRVIQVVQAAGTVVATVGQSSFAAGLTKVYLNQVSTGAGLSTAMSTGTITSAAASPLIAGATGDALGGMYLIPSTGSAPFFWPYVAVSPTSGAIVASAGSLRIASNVAGLYARNAANTADVSIIRTDGGDTIQFAEFGQQVNVGGNIVGAGFGSFGATPATIGTIRLPASTGTLIVQRNAGNTANEQLLPLQSAAANLSADAAFSTLSNTFADSTSIGLVAGTWLMGGQVQVAIGASTAQYIAKLWDGAAVKGSAQADAFNVGGFLKPDNLFLSIPPAIVTLASSATYKISCAALPGTTAVMKAATPGASQGNNATSIWAIRLGQ